VAHEFHNEDEKRVRSVLDAWRDSVHAQTDRPEWFWARQRVRITSKATEQHQGRAPKLAWAGIAAMIALAIAMFAPAPETKPVQPIPSVKAEISDHDLMLALERSMNAGVPSSLAPAGILAQEMNQAIETKAQAQKVKENQYEE
jgi:hypothetical protein